MFDAFRSMPEGAMDPVRVRAVKDLFWSDGETKHLHAKAGEAGTLVARTGAGFIVKFDSGEIRQVMDFQGTVPPRLYKAEEQIELIG